MNLTDLGPIDTVGPLRDVSHSGWGSTSSRPNSFGYLRNGLIGRPLDFFKHGPKFSPPAFVQEARDSVGEVGVAGEGGDLVDDSAGEHLHVGAYAGA